MPGVIACKLCDCPKPTCTPTCGVWTVKFCSSDPSWQGQRAVREYRGWFDCLYEPGDGWRYPGWSGAAGPDVQSSWLKGVHIQLHQPTVANGCTCSWEDAGPGLMPDTSIGSHWDDAPTTDEVLYGWWGTSGLVPRQNIATGVWSFPWQYPDCGVWRRVDHVVGSDPEGANRLSPWTMRMICPPTYYTGGIPSSWSTLYWRCWRQIYMIDRTTVTVMETCPTTTEEWNTAMETYAPFDWTRPDVVVHFDLPQDCNVVADFNPYETEVDYSICPGCSSPIPPGTKQCVRYWQGGYTGGVFSATHTDLCIDQADLPLPPNQWYASLSWTPPLRYYQLLGVGCTAAGSCASVPAVQPTAPADTSGCYGRTTKRWQQTGPSTWGWLTDDFSVDYYSTKPTAVDTWMSVGACPTAYFYHRLGNGPTCDYPEAMPQASNPSWTCPNV